MNLEALGQKRSTELMRGTISQAVWEGWWLGWAAAHAFSLAMQSRWFWSGVWFVALGGFAWTYRHLFRDGVSSGETIWENGRASGELREAKRWSRQ